MDPKALDAAQRLEALVLQRVFEASGAFHGSASAGSAVRDGLFVEALSEAVAKAGGLGLATNLAANLGPRLPDDAAQATVTSAFGPRIDPLDGHLSHHDGIDLAARVGDSIRAAAPGVVRHSGWRPGYGECVEIDHGGGVTTLYAHASALRVRSGDSISAGETIALAGQSGRATGPHLHFELRVEGRPVDPNRALMGWPARADGRGKAP